MRDSSRKSGIKIKKNVKMRRGQFDDVCSGKTLRSTTMASASGDSKTNSWNLNPNRLLVLNQHLSQKKYDS